MHRKQLTVFAVLLSLYALSAFLTYTFFGAQLAASVGVPLPDMGIPDYVLGLANAGIVLVFYGLLGVVGYWFAYKLDLPGIYVPDAGWRRWVSIPLVLGLGCGVLLVLGDAFFAAYNDFGRFVHPGFPVSILASLSAGIGEEVAFRMFVFGLWALILTWAFRRILARRAAFWLANSIAALVFGAGHMGTLLVLTGAASPLELNPVLLLEIFLLNGLVGVVAGECYIRDGLVAAAGVHFWTDIVFHVAWGLLS